MPRTHPPHAMDQVRLLMIAKRHCSAGLRNDVLGMSRGETDDGSDTIQTDDSQLGEGVQAGIGGGLSSGELGIVEIFGLVIPAQ